MHTVADDFFFFHQSKEQRNAKMHRLVRRKKSFERTPRHSYPKTPEKTPSPRVSPSAPPTPVTPPPRPLSTPSSAASSVGSPAFEPLPLATVRGKTLRDYSNATMDLCDLSVLLIPSGPRAPPPSYFQTFQDLLREEHIPFRLLPASHPAHKMGLHLTSAAQMRRLVCILRYGKNRDILV